ncbi:PEP-CTERM protein-sorting domain-containing protein [Nitrosospira briensis]|uniref:PEP-CTERM protein-sorting domain-containing protein n=1 Tax=Nitrosospira briensis TaxID=35799 RepID=A0A1I4XVU8_9PROT|nr:PEP-CTERM sorting domain-containing protein [Nitrosospira briensis]SFN29806.1 PEP-CTERM protein-sorting domain-containing protein [Nitrosospira briensis]
MKNTKKIYLAKNIKPAQGYFRVLPIAAALAASGFIQPAFAVDRTWFGGNGDWELNTNWSPSGVPGNGDKGIINSGNSTLSFNSGIAGLDFFGGSLRGAGDLAVSGLTTFTGGQIGGDGGDVIANGGLTISGAAEKTLGYFNGPVSSGIVNNGTATWTGAGNLDNQNSGRFTNSANGNLNIQTDADFLNGTLVNQGTLTKSVGAADGSDKTVISGVFENSGSVNVQQGTLSIIGSGTHTGSFTSSPDSWIEFAAGFNRAQQLNAGASVTGNVRMIDTSGGTFVNSGATYDATRTEIVAGGRLSFTEPSQTANTDTLSVSGGALRGAGDLAVSGLTTFTGGQIGGDGGDVIANGGLTISGAAEKTLGYFNGPVSSGIVNNGTATWTGAGNLDNQNSGRFTNSANGNLNIQTDADFLNGTLVNQGTLTKSVGAADGSDKTVISGVFENSGSVNVQQGTLEVTRAFNNQGVINVATGAIFHGNNGNFANDGILQGNGTIQTEANNDLINTGEINPGDSVGHLTIDGDLNQASGGVINFELASLSSFDQLTVTDDVTLGGEIAIWNLGYTPVAGDSFVVATFDERADTRFSSFSVNGFNPDLFKVQYHDHDVTVAVIPEPEQYLMLLAGLGLMGVVARRQRNGIRGCDEAV